MQGLAPIAWLNATDYGRDLRDIARAGLRTEAARDILARTDRRILRMNPEHVNHTFVAMTWSMLRSYFDGGKSDPIRMLDDVRAHDVVSACLSFEMHGRQVFSLDQNLVEELRGTDVSDVPGADVLLPYPGFYLRFEGGVDLGNGMLVDGVWIQDEQSTTSDEPDEEQSQQEDDGPKRTIMVLPLITTAEGGIVPALPAHLNLDAESVLDDFREFNRKGFNGYTANFLKQMRETAAEMGNPERGEFSNWDPEAMDRNMAQAQAISVNLAEIVMPLVLNTIMFIDDEGEQAPRGWPADAPRDLAEKASSDRPGAAKAAQKLVQLGWTRVTLLSLSNAQDADGTSRPHGSPRAHWRRAHRRWQWCGEGRSERRRVKVRAARVGGGPLAEGRIYDIPGQDDAPAT